MKNSENSLKAAAEAHRSQMLWSTTVAVAVAILTLYQVFTKAPSQATDTVYRLESREPAAIR